MTLSASRRLARFVVGLKLKDLPAPVVEQTGRLALDTLGCCLAAARSDFGRATRVTAERLGGPPESTLVGSTTRVAAANAVLANATLAHEYLADGSWTKRLHPGWAAHAGVVAALLAQAGFTGPETVLEGEHGFYRAFAGGHDQARLDELLGSLGIAWELQRLMFKPYPCGSIAQPYMD